ncbi:PTS sugar transporter subunit IIA [Algibacillus agarilyticus]|uniref:PTS sugar transporter subunit IIA n=1 Tax=Algibacillus agarilyticus TaxID=2234133 RepID=UPI000DCF8F3E|nr:PTS glucose transporter subunit IIA [Algibacillus agarilyticus]
MDKTEIIHPFSQADLTGSFAIAAPCNAHVKPLAQHPRPLVANGYFGTGVMFEPFGYKFYSPLAGVLTHMPQTCHQIKLKSKQGIQLHIEFGQQTENLMATGFKLYKSTGDKVEKGDLLFEFDLARMKRELPSIISFLTITNTQQLACIFPFYHEVHAITDNLLNLKVRSKK